MKACHFKLILIFGLLLLLSGEFAFAKKMYRWEDEHGNVFFSDQVPPEQVQYKRETLSDKAKVVDVVEKAKTPEQIELQNRLNMLRKEQEKIVAKQAANDKVLLSSFRTLEDMNRALQNKLSIFEAQQKVLEGNVKRFIQQLQQLQQQAAEHERNARAVPQKLLTDIAAGKQQIEGAKQELDKLMDDKQKSVKEFKADMARFQFLTQPEGDVRNPGKSLAASNAANSLGLFICEDSAQCEKAWKIAGEFVVKYSTTGQDVETDKLIMRTAPAKDDDLSLSVSKLESSGQQQIFLDVRCKQSSIGTELCLSGKVQAIRQGFSPYIQSLLAPKQ